jgi:hypothetical protein
MRKILGCVGYFKTRETGFLNEKYGLSGLGIGKKPGFCP